MGIRYQKRVNLGSGLGLNISKSGLSTSYRTKYGSIGPRGFSIRTGIPGLTFRSGFGKSQKGNGAIIFLAVLLFTGVLIITVVVVWNIFLLFKWLIVELYKLIMRARRRLTIKKEIELKKESNDTSFVSLSKSALPSEYHTSKVKLEGILVEDYSEINQGDEIAVISLEQRSATLIADEKGKITFYKTPGETIRFGDYIYKIEKNHVILR